MMKDHPNEHKKRVAVAMSGGVDSSVAAALLVEQGYDVVGIMMRLWSESLESAVATVNRCCTPEQMADARHVAEQLDIPFYVIDTQSQFRNTIVQHFIDEHEAGRTPNPCIACNRQIRFTYLLQHAQALGAQYLATGHYARIRRSADSYELLKGMDNNKDQSYVLHVLNQEKLASVLFPIGEYQKEQVRELARRFDLPVASKQESQDLCFIVDGDHKGFLQRHSSEGFASGPILDQSGKELGRHKGLAFFTIGQRKGLGISSEHPVYVIRKDKARNALVIGPRQALEQTRLRVRDLNWISGIPVSPGQSIQVKIRYKAKAVPGTVFHNGDQTASVELEQPVTGVTPGQGAVFYDNEICLGGGIIADSLETVSKETKLQTEEH